MASTEFKTINGIPLADTTARSNIEALEEEIQSKQGKLTQGDGITIDDDNKISADINDTVTSTSKTESLSANMGKALQDQINNLKNIGRFLSVWDCTTGKPLTEPVEGAPYTYKTGDYYRVGTVAAEGDTNYKPDGATYTGAASTVVETEEVTIGSVYYYDGDSWEIQAAGAGGKVQDVQVNGTTILNLSSGVANITTSTGLQSTSSGIGLTSAVQTSLGKADTALQDVKVDGTSIVSDKVASISTTAITFTDAEGTETTINVLTK